MTRIDWWISTRDTILFLIYLGTLSYIIMGNEIEKYAVYVLILLYINHVILMKFNHQYEVAIKKGLASFLEVKELHKIANKNIDHFHYNLETRFPCIEVLNKIEFKQEGDILIFENVSKFMSKSMNTGGQFMAR